MFYINYLYTHIGPVPTCPPSPLPLDNDAAHEFKVEHILDCCLGCYGIEYLVKWLGYPIFEAMKEPVEYPAHAPYIFH